MPTKPASKVAPSLRPPRLTPEALPVCELYFCSREFTLPGVNMGSSIKFDPERKELGRSYWTIERVPALREFRVHRHEPGRDDFKTTISESMCSRWDYFE